MINSVRVALFTQVYSRHRYSIGYEDVQSVVKGCGQGYEFSTM